jgi:kumamolisin
MHARTKSGLRSAAVTAALLAVTGALPATALASGPASAAQVSATLLLRSPDARGTEALAATTGLSRTERMRRLATTLPLAATKTAARAAVGALGLTVDNATPWSLVVHGPASAVAALVASGSGSGSVTSAPTLVPEAAMVVTGGPTGILQPRALRPLTGADFRAAYGASNAAPTGPNAPVVATLQLAGWNPADLTNFAAANGLPAPGPTTFTPISIDGANPGLIDTVNDSSIEVALDQESIYSVNPAVAQRAYFAADTAMGVVDAIEAVATDAYTSSSIVALSTSWGSCEMPGDKDFLDFMTAVHTALADAVAAGVTVFAASGDAGSADCGPVAGQPSTNAVDFPASDPLVVAVGGTNLDTVGPVETAWGNVDTPDASFQGSGGGVSVLFPRPAYQAGVAATSAFREVPDIAADASDKSPFRVTYGSQTYSVWGTSLAAPISAALLTTELASRGLTNGGVGDIHTALYSAPSTSFRDITAGTNGAYAAAPGYDMVTGLGAVNWHAVVDQLSLAPVVHAPAYQKSRTIIPTVTAPGGQSFIGWATGTGTPPACSTATGRPTTPASVTVPADGVYTVWAEGYLGYQRCVTGVTTVVVDNGAPAVSLSAKASSTSGKHVKYSWAVSDKLSGVSGVDASVLRNGKKIWSGHTAGSGTITLKGQLGSSYQLVVAATDNVGNATTAKHLLAVAYDDKSFTFSTGWSRVTSHAAFGGKLVKSAKPGATAHLKAYGSTFSLLTTTCSTCGIVEVFVDGRHVHDISLFSKGSKPQRAVKLFTSSSAKLRSITLVVKGTKAPGGKGVTLNVDGLLAL